MGDYIIRDWHNEALCQRHPDPDIWHYENSMFQDEQQLEVQRGQWQYLGWIIEL
jgi:hypothetical protein